MSELIERLQNRATECGELLGFAVSLPTSPQHDGSAHLEVRGSALRYVVTERGQELESRATQDEDELLYWFVANAVFEYALKYELRHRVPGQDSRRIMFQKELELLKKLDFAWAERKQTYIEGILKEYPFNDAG